MIDYKEYYNDHQSMKVMTDDQNKLQLQYYQNEKDTYMTFYHVFEGIDVVYNLMNMEKCLEPKYDEYSENIIEINHCRQGRFHCALEDGRDLYLGVGEMEANILGIKRKEANFPLGFYEGVEILIDLPKVKETLGHLFPNIIEQVFLLKDTLMRHGQAMLVKKIPEIEHIFNELYSVKDEIKVEYMRIKVLELLTVIQVHPFEDNQKEQTYFSRQDLDKIKSIHKDLITHLDQKMTLEDMSHQYHISTTQLKKCFKEVYGMPYYTYIKHYKMHKAVHYLEETNDSITTIAGLLGYDNPSKFISAFKSIIHYTPNEYRKHNVHLEHLNLFGVELNDEIHKIDVR